MNNMGIPLHKQRGATFNTIEIAEKPESNNNRARRKGDAVIKSNCSITMMNVSSVAGSCGALSPSMVVKLI